MSAFLALKAENKRLSDRVRLLEHALGFDLEVPREWRLTRCEAAVFGLLYRRKGTVSRDAVMTVLYGDRPDPPSDKIVNIFIWKLRRKLDPFGIEIATRHGIGWELLPEARKVARSYIGGGTP